VKPATALALYPIWALALSVALTALRVGRSSMRGLVVFAFGLSLWVGSLAALAHPGARSIAERLLPAGMIVAGAVAHSAADVARAERRWLVWTNYTFALLVAAAGAWDPRLYFGPGGVGRGPLFLPLGVLAFVGVVVTLVWILHAARGVDPPRARRLHVLAVADLLAALGGGGLFVLHAHDLVPIEAAPFPLLPAVLLVGWVTASEERGRFREAFAQAMGFALVTALLSAVGLVAFYFALPRLAPEVSIPWLAFVVFCATLPFDPLRLLVVERVGAVIFRRPIAVRELTLELEEKEQAREHAEGLAEIGRLASAVAHEVRNPLGVIAAELRLLEREGVDPERTDEIRRQVERTTRFLNELLAYAKPRPLDLREVDLREAMELASSHARGALGSLPEDRVALSGEGIFVEGDRAALTDVGTILLTNALIATDGASAPVRLVVEETETGARVVIEDDGPGVPKELEARLFQAFATGRGRDHVHPGTGLGLALAKRWVERHGGTLRHERPAAGGARFVALLPRRAA